MTPEMQNGYIPEFENDNEPEPSPAVTKAMAKYNEARDRIEAAQPSPVAGGEPPNPKSQLHPNMGWAARAVEKTQQPIEPAALDATSLPELTPETPASGIPSGLWARWNSLCANDAYPNRALARDAIQRAIAAEKRCAELETERDEESASADLHADLNRRAAKALGKPTEGDGSSWHDIPEWIDRLRERLTLAEKVVEAASELRAKVILGTPLGSTLQVVIDHFFEVDLLEQSLDAALAAYRATKGTP